MASRRGLRWCRAGAVRVSHPQSFVAALAWASVRKDTLTAPCCGRYDRREIMNRPKLVHPGDPQAMTTPRRFQSAVGPKHGSSWTSDTQRSADLWNVNSEPRKHAPR